MDKSDSLVKNTVPKRDSKVVNLDYSINFSQPFLDDAEFYNTNVNT